MYLLVSALAMRRRTEEPMCCSAGGDHTSVMGKPREESLGSSQLSANAYHRFQTRHDGANPVPFSILGLATQRSPRDRSAGLQEPRPRGGAAAQDLHSNFESSPASFASWRFCTQESRRDTNKSRLNQSGTPASCLGQDTDQPGNRRVYFSRKGRRS
jgi:hypothetical protein